MEGKTILLEIKTVDRNLKAWDMKKKERLEQGKKEFKPSLFPKASKCLLGKNYSRYNNLQNIQAQNEEKKYMIYK